VHIGPVTSLAMVAALFIGGIVLSVIADRRDPEGAERHREEAEERAKGAKGKQAEEAPSAS
jgi:hypothetical protein